MVFAAFAALFKRPILYQAFGFTQTRPILMGLLIIFQYVLSPYFEVRHEPLSLVINSMRLFPFRSFIHLQ